jgi:hypothetical protein
MTTLEGKKIDVDWSITKGIKIISIKDKNGSLIELDS